MLTLSRTSGHKLNAIAPKLNPIAPKRRQQGTILISVMLLFAIGAFIAAEMTYRQQIDIQRTSAILSVSQAKEYIRGAEEIAQFALAEDLKNDQLKPKKWDHIAEAWGTKLEQPLDGGMIKGSLVDMQGRFNLNWFMTKDKAKLTLFKNAFISLLTQLKIPKKGNAQAIADQLIDFMDEDSTPTFPDGKEEQEYMLEALPRRAANRLLTDVSELLLLPAISAQDLEALAPYVNVLPPTVGLNLNAVALPVIKSFQCVEGDFVVNNRPPKGYDTVSKAIRFKKTANCKNVKAAFPVAYGLSSEFFELNAEAEVNGKIVKVRSVLYRDNAQKSNIKVKVIYRRQVDPFSKV